MKNQPLNRQYRQFQRKRIIHLALGAGLFSIGVFSLVGLSSSILVVWMVSSGLVAVLYTAIDSFILLRLPRGPNAPLFLALNQPDQNTKRKRRLLLGSLLSYLLIGLIFAWITDTSTEYLAVIEFIGGLIILSRALHLFVLARIEYTSFRTPQTR